MIKMSLRMYQTYSPVAVQAAREIGAAMHELPVPISVMNAVSSGVVTVADLLATRFSVGLSPSGGLVSLVGYSPVTGFAVFVQGVRHAPGSDVRAIFVPPGGFVEVVPAV